VEGPDDYPLPRPSGSKRISNEGRERSRVAQGPLPDLEFSLSKNMVQQFVELTGDRSSLHTDASFARRSLIARMLFMECSAAISFCLGSGAAASVRRASDLEIS
jgi:acyl dehydratase